MKEKNNQIKIVKRTSERGFCIETIDKDLILDHLLYIEYPRQIVSPLIDYRRKDHLLYIDWNSEVEEPIVYNIKKFIFYNTYCYYITENEGLDFIEINELQDFIDRFSFEITFLDFKTK